VKYNDKQLDVIRTELAHAEINQMTPKEQLSYLHQVIYNKYITMTGDELEAEVDKRLGSDIKLGMETAFRFEEWLAKKYKISTK